MTEKSRNLICRALVLYLLLWAGHALGIEAYGIPRGHLESLSLLVLGGSWSVFVFVFFLGPLMGSIHFMTLFSIAGGTPLAISSLILNLAIVCTIAFIVIRAWFRTHCYCTMLILGSLTFGYSMLVTYLCLYDMAGM